MTAPDLVVLGNLLVDDVVFPDGRTRMGEAGGATLYASLGAALKGRSGQVIWAAQGRSDATTKRAELADLVPVRDVAELAARADVVVSICAPAAALEVAEQVAGYGRPAIYVSFGSAI